MLAPIAAPKLPYELVFIAQKATDENTLKSWCLVSRKLNNFTSTLNHNDGNKHYITCRQIKLNPWVYYHCGKYFIQNLNNDGRASEQKEVSLEQLLCKYPHLQSLFLKGLAKKLSLNWRGIRQTVEDYKYLRNTEQKDGQKRKLSKLNGGQLEELDTEEYRQCDASSSQFPS
jgi:hypothetical protein